MWRVMKYRYRKQLLPNVTYLTFSFFTLSSFHVVSVVQYIFNLVMLMFVHRIICDQIAQ